MNTANREMVEDFAGLKKRGINLFIMTTTDHTTGKTYPCVSRKTAQGVSAYANKMYDKYGDGTEVEVGYFDENLNWKVYCVYGA